MAQSAAIYIYASRGRAVNSKYATLFDHEGLQSHFLYPLCGATEHPETVRYVPVPQV